VKSLILQEETSRLQTLKDKAQFKKRWEKDCQFAAFLLEKYVALQVQVHKFNYNKHDDNVVVMVMINI
jgi:hypothetical protein